MKTKFKFKFKLVIAKMAMTGCGMNNSSFAQTFVKPPGRNGNTTNTPAAVGVGASLALALHPALGAGLNYPTGSGSRFFETGAGSFFRNTCFFRSEETGTVENFTKNTAFEYDKSKFYLNIGLSISLKYFNIIEYYSCSGSKSDIWSSQVQVGLSVPLIRKYRYY